MIKCLPPEVQAKLRSGVALPSLQQCVEELILNSIDAEATCVAVRMDMEAFKVQVLDNGAGMDAEDMECVGNRYFTSKCSSVEDLDNLSWYGFRGEALASVVSLATLVEISSRTRSSARTHVKIFKDGKRVDVYEAENSRPSAGTTVVICNFFYSLPVRRKRMDPVLEGERIRHRVEAISLMHPFVSFTLKNDCTGAMLLQLPKAKNTYHRFIQIHGLNRAQNLGEVSHAHKQFQVIGFIGREGHYNNSLQFLYVNERLLLKTLIHKLLNSLLRRLSTLYKKPDSLEGHSTNRSPKPKRSQELHGVYIINIKCSYSEYDVCLEPAKTLIEFKDWESILLCIEEAVKAFLKRENLMDEVSEDDLPPKLSGAQTTDPEWHNSAAGGQAISSVSPLEHSIGLKLASEPVHRKCKEDRVHDGSFCPESGLMEEETEELGQKEISADELEKLQSKGMIQKECRDEPLADVARLEPASDNNMTEDKGQMLCKNEELCQTLCKSNSVRELESETLELSNKGEMSNNTASTSNATSVESINQTIQPDLNCLKQTLPDKQDGGKQRPTVVINRKISLSDPFIHACLQAPDSSQINKAVQVLERKCEEKTSGAKCKTLQDGGNDRFYLKLSKNFAPVIPSKIPRILPCPKVSLHEESGSLETFRRAYGKSDELKLASQESHPEDNAKLPLTDGYEFNLKKLSVRYEDQRDAEENEDTRKSKGPQTLVVSTNWKPISTQIGSKKKSLAAKLRHLKQHRMEDPNELVNSCRTDGFQDISDDMNPSDGAPNPEPLPGCSTDVQLAEKEEGTASGDWLLHYDACAGKAAYVNRVTGLSRYNDPSAEEVRVRCTSDVTNLAVSVISELGMEYRCYPFQGDLVLPFLPKSKAERVISLGLDDQDDSSESSNSLASLYSKWNNPVFVRPPMVGVDISSRQAEGLAVKVHNILFPYRFSKAMIHSMKVIHQVDKKFLACLISTRDGEPAAPTETEGNLLVLVDQHAVHERVRLENLVAGSYEDDPDAPGERRLCSSTILPPLEISLTEEELRLFRSCQPHFRNLGLEVQFSHTADPRVFIGKVPVCFMEKESNELRRGRPSVIKHIVEEYLHEQIELLRSTGRVRGTLPLTVLKVLASIACHGAIKFNHSLTKDECDSLVASLSSCDLPFQCAHGRPSIAPLVDILHLDKDQQELQKPNLLKLRRMYKAWELYGKK